MECDLFRLRGISDGWARVANLFSQLSHMTLSGCRTMFYISVSKKDGFLSLFASEVVRLPQTPSLKQIKNLLISRLDDSCEGPVNKSIGFCKSHNKKTSHKNA
jgi:hypothetical protein